MTDQEIIDALREITGFSILKGELVFARKLRAAAERIRVLGEAIDEIAKEKDGGYGFYHGGDPRNFCPDSENTPEELAAHRAACEKWDEAEAKGEKLEPEPDGSGWISPTIHVTRSSYGMGAYTFPTNGARLAQAARAATDAARGGTKSNPPSHECVDDKGMFVATCKVCGKTLEGGMGFTGG